MKHAHTLALVSLFTALTIHAQLVDFETLPGGTSPSPGMAISNQYAAAYGLSFQCENGNFPVLAMRGSTNPWAFTYGPTGITNQPAPNQEVGNLFLTSNPGGLYPSSDSNALNLIITYGVPVSNASGVVLDIDSYQPTGGAEAWNVRAYNGTNLLGTIALTVNTPNAGDGLATPWTFTHTNADINSIRIEYVGAKTNGIGFAFDNLSPAWRTLPAALGIERTNGATQLEVTGTAGTNPYYNLEWTPSLNPANWQPLAALFLTNAPFASILDQTSPGIPQRFYRATEAFAPCVAAPSGLVAWWPGDGSAADLTGNHPGTLSPSGVTFASGEVGQAFNFSGVNSFVQTFLDVQPSAMSNTMWEAWVYPTHISYTLGSPILSDDGGNLTYGRSLIIGTNSNFGIFTGTGIWQPVVAWFNEWQHVAVVYSATNILFYKNGVAYSYGAAPSGQATTNPLLIGENPATGNHFEGMIDEVSIYNRVLSASEIQSVYEAGSSGKCK